MTVVPDGTISGWEWVPVSRRGPSGYQTPVKRGPCRGLGSEHRYVADVEGVGLEEGGSLQGSCASVYLSNRRT